jgi:hypothetical protein
MYFVQAVYEPIASGPDDDDHEHNFSYIKCIDHGKQVMRPFVRYSCCARK